jgi:hypothetical protein
MHEVIVLSKKVVGSESMVVKQGLIRVTKNSILAAATPG